MTIHPRDDDDRVPFDDEDAPDESGLGAWTDDSESDHDEFESRSRRLDAEIKRLVDGR